MPHLSPDQRLPVDVLYFEDSPTDGLIISETLESDPLLNANVTIVPRLSEGIALLMDKKFDIALLDLNLPDSQGMDSFRRLRNACPEVPFIVLSGLSVDENAAEMLREGAQDYLLKGAPAQQIISRSIRFAIERHRVRMELDQRTRQLAESEARLQTISIIESSVDPAIVIDQCGLIQFMNPAAQKLFRLSTADYGMPFKYSVTANSTTELKLEGYGTTSVILEMRSAEILWDKQRAHLATLRDITQHKKIQSELQQALDHLENVIINVPLFLWVLDPQGITTLNGGTLLQKIGLKPGEAVGRSVFDMFADIPEIIESARKALNGESVHTTLKIGELITDCWYSPTYDKAGNLTGTIGIAIDITNEVKLEEQFRQAQKMDAVGKLAGGVAHDFNNLLTVILGYTEILLESKANSGDREMLSGIRNAAIRAGALTNQLLAFSRKSVFKPVPTHINSVILESESMFRRIVGEDVTITTVLANDVGFVNIDPTALDQALLNLIVNGRDAMPKGGKLTIETANVEIDASYVESNPKAKPGPHIRISVSDNGHGIPAELQSRVFEPFFTTKAEGKGTGLGLSTVYGIVAQTGGHINLYSEVGVGTVFKIYLPRKATNGASSSITPEPVEIVTGTETILFVEDDDAVRGFGETILKRAGYTVLSAADGVKALQLSKQHLNEIQLLITDVVMPGMGGRDLAEKLTGIKKDLKVLYLSGYTDDAILRHGVLRADVQFLGKPYTRTELLNKIQTILDSTSVTK